MQKYIFFKKYKAVKFKAPFCKFNRTKCFFGDIFANGNGKEVTELLEYAVDAKILIRIILIVTATIKLVIF